MTSKERIMDSKYDQQSHGLYRSEYEHDACGVGMVRNNRISVRRGRGAQGNF